MKGQPTLLFLVAVVSLIGIGIVAGFNFLKANLNVINETKKVNVLGDKTLDINRFFTDTFQSGKEVAGQKVTDVQKNIMSTVEKEVSSLAQSQVDALKLQICRDWGVIPPTPTKTP